MREPYTFEVKSAPVLGWPTFDVLFDDSVIREITIPLNAIKELVTLLNQVYQVGYIEGKVGL